MCRYYKHSPKPRSRALVVGAVLGKTPIGAGQGEHQPAVLIKNFGFTALKHSVCGCLNEPPLQRMTAGREIAPLLPWTTCG